MIQLPVISGILNRRILLNYRLDPGYLTKILPRPFKPRLYKGMGIGGVCMIRFSALRPQFAPAFLGIDSENAAHRIAVEWEVDGKNFEGVYIPKRNTASSFNYYAGGRVFPGVFQKSFFQVEEGGNRYKVDILSESHREKVVSFDGQISKSISAGSIFPDLEEASAFFAKGSIGYSLSRDESHFQGMELRLLEWQIEPMKITSAFAQLFEDREKFPIGTAELDSAMLMKNLKHEWHRIPVITS
jgi:hypothetical protein